MHLEIPQYMAQLNAAKNIHLLDWKSPGENVYEREVGKLTLRVTVFPGQAANWQIQHERSGILTHGSSESYSVAQVEMIMYAEHWVRTAMVGVLA